MPFPKKDVISNARRGRMRVLMERTSSAGMSIASDRLGDFVQRLSGVLLIGGPHRRV